MKPKVFTKDDPCTKVDLHNCFYEGGRYVNRPVVEAKAVIGENAPKYLIREEFVVVRTIGNVDYYCLTPEGDEWLRRGILKYLDNHPERFADCTYPPPGYGKGSPAAAVARRVIVRRQEPPKAPASRVIRRVRT